MARHRQGMTARDRAALATLIVALVTVAIAVITAAAKLTFEAIKWLAATVADLASTDPTLRIRARLRITTILSAVVTVVGLAVIERYSDRGEWYQRYASLTPVFSLATLSSLAALLWVLWRVALRRRTESVALRVAPAALFMAGVAVGSVAFAVDHPTVARARSALREGDEARASIEANAVRERDPAAAAQVEPLLDELRMASFRRASSIEERAGFLSQSWFTTAARDGVARTVNDELRAEADRAFSARDRAKLDRLGAAAGALPVRRRIDALRALATVAVYDGASAETCPSAAVDQLRSTPVDGLDSEGVLRAARARIEPRLSDLAQRATRERADSLRLGLWLEARELARCVRLLTRAESAPTEAEIDRHVSDATRANAAAQAASIAAAQRAARRAVEREPEPPRASRSQGSGYLLCNDGTRSPSCRCDRGSWRGCCSHHGGVSGCDE